MVGVVEASSEACGRDADAVFGKQQRLETQTCSVRSSGLSNYPSYGGRFCTRRACRLAQVYR